MTKPIATLCVLTSDEDHKFFALSPRSDHWFVNRADLAGEYAKLADMTESRGTVIVLGMMFAAGDDQ